MVIVLLQPLDSLIFNPFLCVFSNTFIGLSKVFRSQTFLFIQTVPQHLTEQSHVRLRIEVAVETLPEIDEFIVPQGIGPSLVEELRKVGD